MVSPPEDLDQRTRILQATFDSGSDEAVTRRLGARLTGNELNRADEWTHPRRPDDSSSTGNELNRADEWTHHRRPDDSSSTNSRRRRS